MSDSDDTKEALKKLCALIADIRAHEEGYVAIQIKRSKNVSVGKLLLTNYAKVAEIEDSSDINFGDIESTAPSDLKKIRPILESIVKAIQSEEKPKHSLTNLISKLGPFGSWATLLYTILHNGGLV